MKPTFDWRKYAFAFVITALIFGTAVFLSDYFGQKKIDEIRAIQEKISIDILSSETQFALLEESACNNDQATTTNGTTLSDELGSLADKLSQTEQDRGADDAEVQSLKRYYSLLQIKDYLLMMKISQKCKTKPVAMIYFYSNQGDCPDCEREGYVLTRLRETYPELRVYAFDYHLDLSAVKTLVSINKVENKLPALFIDGKAYYGFQSVEDLEKAVPELNTLKTLKASSTSATATSTKRK